MITSKTTRNDPKDTAETVTSKPEPITGFAQVREAEIYNCASVADDAAMQAERLCTEIQRALSEAFFNRNDRRAGELTTAETAESPEIRDKAIEAINCLAVAQEYLYRLAPAAPASAF